MSLVDGASEFLQLLDVTAFASRRLTKFDAPSLEGRSLHSQH